ncbi:hypothetical protein CXB51_001922 [Gossypium anomalum]|uniref:DUF7745 domain-containing protein n=1 Tax=Gossypium anomalum TaxID=47600 RepID=A0A8J6DF74_9ROSI|nr:hypothetical protein CXB51_001922 [Gossypium anomalum]
MRNEYLDKVEDNASNEFQELRDIWAQWDDGAKQLFYQNYGDLPYFLDIKVDKHLFRAMVQFWNPAYSCFTFGEVDLVPTLEEYTTLLRMSEQWVAARIQRKGDGKCIPWASLRDLILANLDVKRRVDVLALSIYGLVIFPKAMGHVDEAVADLFDKLGKLNTPVPAILAETFRSLNACRRIGEGMFIGCAQLLLVWFHSHFWKVDKVPCRVFFKDYSQLKEAAAIPRRDDITEKRWIEILQKLQKEDVMWKAPWMTPSEILYRCESFDWGAIGYTLLLVLRQYKADQFIPATHGLAQSDFSYKRDHYKKKIREILRLGRRPSLEAARSMEKNLRVIPSELEVIKQEFEGKNLELGRKIERLKEEKMYLSLDVDVQKIKVEKVRKEKRKIKEDRDDLKMQYKKTQLSLKRAGLGKSSEQWQEEVQEERAKVDCNSTVELKASLKKIEEMKHNIGRLEAALQNYELRIEQLEAREGHWKEELHHLQDQVRDKDYLMGEAIVQIREVADHLQDLAAQANVLSIKYELVTDRGLELALLLDRIKTLGLRAKAYL